MKRLLMFLGILSLGSLPLQAGGHLNAVNGNPVVYKSSIGGQPLVISYKIDLGALGLFADTTAQRLTRESFKVWQDVPTAAISFSDAGFLPVNVDKSNYSTYLNNFSDGINPMVFDHDGEIINALLGEGQSERVIGFAGSSYYTSGPNTGFYAEGHAVMNGTMAGTSFTYDEFKSTFIHEFGHFIGLDHSQINATFASNGNSADDEYLPTMYPTSTDDDTKLATLNPDDLLAVSRLYPATGFLAAGGTISGTVTREGGAVVRGANVVAVSTTDSLYYRVSTVTDYLVQNNGVYTISALAPGTYWVFIEPIRSSFTGGSSVGPYADNSTDLSFQSPVTPEYYNGANESHDPAVDDPLARTMVTVTAGVVTTASFIANGEAAPGTETTLEDFGTPTFVFELPSEYDDTKYAVRFTPGINANLVKTDFLLRQTGGIEGNGTLKVSVHQHTTGSVAGVPGTQIGSTISVPFTTLTSGVYNEIDLTSLGVTVQTGVHFHIAFEVEGVAGDTLSFVGDDAATPTDRSSSWYDGGSGAQWYNFSDASNYGTGYNLVIRAYLSPLTGIKEDQILYPEGFVLGQNYPNPFNPSTVLPFTLGQEGVVTLAVYDMLGRRVATIIDGKQYEAGRHSAAFDAAMLRSGMYMAVLTQHGHSSSRKMMLMK